MNVTYTYIQTADLKRAVRHALRQPTDGPDALHARFLEAAAYWRRHGVGSHTYSMVACARFVRETGRLIDYPF
jgi:hypothetical protein